MRHDMEEAAVAEGCWRLLDQSQARKASWLDLGDITTEDLMWMRMDPLLVKLLHHGPLTSPSSFTISAAGTWLSSSPAPRGRKPQRAP